MNREEFIRQSLELDLFWTRIMKEHCIFLAAGLPPPKHRYIQNFDRFKVQFEMLLAETAELSGALPPSAGPCGAFVTEYTETMENRSAELTGISINTRVTATERAALQTPRTIPAGRLPALYEAVKTLNHKAAVTARALLELQHKLLDEILKGEAFSANYPAVYMHMNDEAAEFINNLDLLSSNEAINVRPCVYEEFWNRNLKQHAATVRGLLDPGEDALFARSDQFARAFGDLNTALNDACQKGEDSAPETDRARAMSADMRAYNLDIVKEIMQNRLKSVILPLLADHLLRESNYYIMLLKSE
ncbi:hypothetical protein FACS1894211_06310 [Clostridia bacterium]|nr:hypothetical protein FACS1894211_06310 [Clostridia bacterium]